MAKGCRVMRMGYLRKHTTCWLLLIVIIYQKTSATNTTISSTGATSSNSTTAATTTATITATTTRPPVIGENCTITSCTWNNSVCEEGICRCNNDSFEANNMTCIKVSDLYPERPFLPATERSLTLIWGPYTNPVANLINSSILNIEVTVAGTPAPQMSSCLVFFISGQGHANCTGLTPGGMYTVTYIIYMSNEHLYNTSWNNSTKPAVPGAINKTESNFDASNFTLEWQASEGLVDNYMVNVTEVTGSICTNRSGSIINTTSDNSTMIRLTGLQHGRNYTTVIVANRFSQRSEASEDMFNTIVKHPPSPTEVVVKQDSVSNNSMTLSWTGPNDFNGPCQGYIICVMESIYFDGQLINVGCYKESNVTFHAQNLTAGAFYSFSVYSVNSEYNSTNATTSEVIQTKEGTPDIVMEVRVVSIDDIIKVMWDRPKHPYGNITAYKIEVWNSGNSSDCHILWMKANESRINTTVENPKCQIQSEQEIKINREKMDVNITSLSPDSNYSIIVTAYTNVGAGIGNSIIITTNETAPGNVTSVKGVAINSTEIVVSWLAPNVRTGTTWYYIEVYDRIENHLKEILNTTGYDVQNFTVESLQEYWVYQFAVYASTSKGNSSHVYSNNVTTLEASPGAVVETMIDFHQNESYCDARNVTFRWVEPELMNRKGNITKYNILLMLENEVTSYTMEVENPNPYSTLSRNWTTTLNTTPERQYKVKVWAVTQTGLNGTITEHLFDSKACNPPSYTGSADLITVQEKSTSSFTVHLYLDFFRNEEQGKIVSFGLVVSKKNFTNVTLETIADFEEGKPFNFPYKLNLRTLQNEVQNKDKTFATYLVKNLPEGTPLYLGQYACTKIGCTLAKYTGPYWTVKSPVSEPPSSTATTAVAIVLVLFAIIAAVVGVVLYRKGYHTRILATLRKHSGDQQDSVAYNDITRDTEHILRKRPFKLSMLEEYLEEMNKDSKLGFAKEYEDIQRLSPRHATEAALLGENKSKNRWVNILAFDHSRVKLQLLDEDDPTSDYINANFIPDLRRQRVYIATQGPLPGTIDDFWRMIWEQKVSVIVMLTKCKEGNRVKCEMYWPNELHEAKQYGDIVVSPISISNLDKFDINVFDVSMNEEKRRVMHFHFQEFPDFSADVDFLTFVNFVKTVRQHSPHKMQGPIVVHCSAGVGRTGTYITVDCLQQLIESPDFDFNTEVDIFDYVLTMRDHRTLMVQVEQQYIMIHECLRILLEQKKQAEAEAEEGVEENLYENQAFDPDTDEETDKLYENASNVPRTEL